MATDTKGIFVSYRRGESDAHAGRLADRFIEHFGEHRVFYDVDLTEPGVDFIDQIQSAVDSSEVLIAVIGKNWVTATDPAGQKRLENPPRLCANRNRHCTQAQHSSDTGARTRSGYA
jgi:hypothetical protein